MNQKAIRQDIEFPFLLNLSENRPFVSEDFRSAEHLNAPYLNNMFMPFWKKDEAYSGSQPVWDSNNNEYRIENGYLTKNGENLFAVNNKHFKREDVTEEFSKYLAFDFSEDGELAKIEWDTGTNTATLTYDDASISQHLFINGVILGARVRVFDDTAIGVVVYEVGSTNHMLYMNTAENRIEDKSIVWCTTIPKTDPNASFSITSINIQSPAPIINIANPLTDVYAVSLISNYGEVLYTRKEGYYTFVDNNGTYIDGTNWVASNGTVTETIKNYQTTNFIFSWQNSSISSTFNAYTRDDAWYYVNDPTTEVPNSDDIAFNPQLIPNETFEYEGVTYQVYRVFQYTNRIVFKSSVDDLFSKTASITIQLNDGHTETAAYTNNAVTIDHSDVYWTPTKVVPVDALITFDNVDYPVDNLNKQFTITIEVAPTTVTAAYLVAPNFFLDNGNMYSWYTIPSANEGASGYAQTLPTGNLIVESGKLTAISGNNYTFDAIESHLVNDYSKYTRCNSIAIAQNFWNSSLKTNSDGVRTPYQIYVAKNAAETFSQTVKYTEYSNSNCSDMLYYSGTCPRTDQPFYKYATANSEDLAWFNPGGFRAGLKGNWKLLYYVDAVGSVACQGISYAESENAMGTLVTPFASLSDAEYISGSNDFVVYCDSHNKFYKISIEDDAQLASVFDNRFIIVNTTSYWNCWDSQMNRKFHYATDYNNRTKLGIDRLTYRANPLIYWTKLDRRKFTTAINPNYNILPRLPITSMIPTTFSMAHILEDYFTTGYIHTYNSVADEAREVQAIEVYGQGTSNTDTGTLYICSVKSYTSGDQFYRDSKLVDISFSDSKAILFTTDIFTTFINGAGNNDFAVENLAKYPLVYNNQNKPMFLYNFVSGIDVDNVKWFFIIQGQYYAVIGEKLYAMIYSNGLISQSDAIVDIRDLKYIGNTPAIAFFVNPYTRQVYSFTGDANLQQIFDASKYHFKFDEGGIELHHFYDESTQSIYVETNEGLLVFGPQNTYCLEEYPIVKDMEFVKGDIHIVTDGKVSTLRYYHDIEDYEPLTINLETSFYGLGSQEMTSIDRWQIVLYDPEHREQNVYLQVRSLTDVSTQAEEKKIHIDSNMWDKWSHSALISFTPKLIKGKGIRLSLKTDSSIFSITPHIMDNKTSQPTNSKFSV